MVSPRVPLHASLLALSLLASVASGCSSEDLDGQRLEATGVVVSASGASASNLSIDSYTVVFVLADGVEIPRSFSKDGDGNDLVTDGDGQFQVNGGNLALSYEWQQDEWECQDVCLEWETTCGMVSEEVCVPVCESVTTEECSEECWDDCVTTCYDETVCDEFGCWVETYCEDDCSTQCQTVCQPTTVEDCVDECHTETWEECNDHCIESEEQCGWVTRTYTSYPDLSEVVSTRTEIAVRDHGGERHVVAADAADAGQAQQCDDGRCQAIDLWVQHDRFILPFEW